MERSATVTWKGSLKEGRGEITTKSRAMIEVPYTYGTRFKDEIGTNPEELIAAAHAGCFNMVLADEIAKEKIEGQNLHTTATISLENIEDRWTITASQLEVTGEVPGISEEKFAELAEKAKNNCPVSRLLNVKMAVKTRLWSKERIVSTSPPLPGEM